MAYVRYLVRNYILAQAHVDAPALASSIAHLNASTTFSPLQPLHDTDVAGFLRHSHEQNLIATIEEGRRETQEDFYRILEDRSRRDWEARKKRIFEELGTRAGPQGKSSTELRRSMRASTALGVCHTSIDISWASSDSYHSNQFLLLQVTCRCKARCLHMMLLLPNSKTRDYREYPSLLCTLYTELRGMYRQMFVSCLCSLVVCVLIPFPALLANTATLPHIG